MQDKMKGWMFSLGFLFIFGGAGTSDSNTSPAEFWWGALLGIVGLTLMSFSFETHRNPNWLKRKYRHLKFEITGRL